MKRNPWVPVTVVIVVVTLLAASVVSQAAVPVGDQTIPFAGRTAAGAGQPEAQPGDVPAGLTAGSWATIQDLIREAQYQFAWQAIDGVWAYRAPNRAHHLSLSLAADGFRATRYSAEGGPLWDFGLSLVAYGEQAFPAAIAEGGLVGSRERVEYHWSRDVVEWYTNSAAGVEHGLTLAAPPAGADGSTVELTFALRGSLTPELDAGGGALRLKDASGQTVLRYDQLAVYDATGRSLPAYLRLTGGLPSANLQLVVDAAGAIYPLTVDPILRGQVAKLTASDTQDDDRFGYSVAVSGDTVVVGAYLEDGAVGGTDRGGTYIFERNKLGTDFWGQVRKLQIVDPEDDAQFGYSVAISGDTVVVGAPYKDNVGGTNCVTGTDCGAAYIFARNRGGADLWGFVTRVNAGGADDNDRFGTSVGISGDTVIVGAPYEDGAGTDRGAAYLFERNQGGADIWGQLKMLTVSGAANYDYFGSSVAISGDTLVVGAWGEDGGGNNRGAAHVFARNHGGVANSWGRVTRLSALDAEDEDLFGRSVAISGDTVVVGAQLEDGGGTDGGAAYVFERNQGGAADNWGQVTKLLASDAANNDYFGESVAISGDTVVVGAWGEDGAGTDRGAAYVFERNRGGADSWGQANKLVASDTQNGDSFGYSVAISGDTVVAGARWEDGANVNSNRGAAYVFVAGGGQWQEVAIAHASDPDDDDRFGNSVAISGDTVVVGAERDDGTGPMDANPGAAYIFERNRDGADEWGQVTKLVASDPEYGAYFGSSVAISGDTVVVGARGKDFMDSVADQGAAYVFARNQGGADVWGQVAKLTFDFGNQPWVYFGSSVAISGDTIVVGASGLDLAPLSDCGAAYIFERNQGGTDHWGLVKGLLASDWYEGDNFGHAVTISGDTIVVGAYGEDGVGGSNRGAAYVFERNCCAIGAADNWGQVQKLIASDAADNEHLGNSVAISGDTVVVGAYAEDGWMSDDRGAAYVFERNKGGAAGNWGQVDKLLASDLTAGDNFGQSVAISGDTVVVGAHLEDGAGTNRGAAYVYERNVGGGDNWGQVTKLMASDAADDDYFGISVSINGDTVVVGAYLEEGGRVIDRGAAYYFYLQPYKIYLPLVVNNN